MIQFQDPPQDGRHDRSDMVTTFTDEVKEILSSNPGKWALVESGHTPGRHSSWHKAAQRSGGRYEVVLRNIDGVNHTYARRVT